jgi:hypothetical protein
MITFYKQVSDDSRLWPFIMVPSDVLTMDFKKNTDFNITKIDRQNFFLMLQYKIYNNKTNVAIKSKAALK